MLLPLWFVPIWILLLMTQLAESNALPTLHGLRASRKHWRRAPVHGAFDVDLYAYNKPLINLLSSPLAANTHGQPDVRMRQLLEQLSQSSRQVQQPFKRSAPNPYRSNLERMGYSGIGIGIGNGSGRADVASDATDVPHNSRDNLTALEIIATQHNASAGREQLFGLATAQHEVSVPAIALDTADAAATGSSPSATTTRTSQTKTTANEAVHVGATPIAAAVAVAAGVPVVAINKQLTELQMNSSLENEHAHENLYSHEFHVENIGAKKFVKLNALLQAKPTSTALRATGHKVTSVRVIASGKRPHEAVEATLPLPPLASSDASSHNSEHIQVAAHGHANTSAGAATLLPQQVKALLQIVKNVLGPEHLRNGSGSWHNNSSAGGALSTGLRFEGPTTALEVPPMKKTAYGQTNGMPNQADDSMIKADSHPLYIKEQIEEETEKVQEEQLVNKQKSVDNNMQSNAKQDLPMEPIERADIKPTITYTYTTSITGSSNPLADAAVGDAKHKNVSQYEGSQQIELPGGLIKEQPAYEDMFDGKHDDDHAEAEAAADKLSDAAADNKANDMLSNGSIAATHMTTTNEKKLPEFFKMNPSAYAGNAGGSTYYNTSNVLQEKFTKGESDVQAHAQTLAQYVTSNKPETIGTATYKAPKTPAQAEAGAVAEAEVEAEAHASAQAGMLMDSDAMATEHNADIDVDKSDSDNDNDVPTPEPATVPVRFLVLGPVSMHGDGHGSSQRAGNENENASKNGNVVVLGNAKKQAEGHIDKGAGMFAFALMPHSDNEVSHFTSHLKSKRKQTKIQTQSHVGNAIDTNMTATVATKPASTTEVARVTLIAGAEDVKTPAKQPSAGGALATPLPEIGAVGTRRTRRPIHNDKGDKGGQNGVQHGGQNGGQSGKGNKGKRKSTQRHPSVSVDSEEEIETTNWWHILPYAEIRKFLSSIYESISYEE